jgi:plastocyanin
MDLMKTLLDVAATFITPDWGALINLLPVFLGILVALWFAWTIRRFATAGPTRRAPARVDPLPPPHLHMPGPSSAPILAAFGAAALFAGLVIGGVALAGGATILVFTLLLWLREAMGDYAHLEPTEILPAVIREPPAGVHMPGPSIRPFMGALGVTALMAGLVIGGWILAVAVIFLAWTLVGWLVDFTAEYRKTEEADRTGHLENIVPRGLPARALQAFAVLFAVVALFQLGILPPGGEAATAPGASPGASPAAEASLPPGTQVVIAKGVSYNTHALTVTAGQPFAILFKNQDGGTDHDIDIRDASGKTIQDQPHVTGVKDQLYNYTALQPGTYTFICSVHPIAQMTGTLTVK